MLSMITNCHFHGCDTVNKREITGKTPGTKVLKTKQKTTQVTQLRQHTNAKTLIIISTNQQ